MKNGKRLLTALLALVMVFTLSVGAFAAEPESTGDEEIVIIHTNDVHGGGMENYALVAALKEAYQKQGAYVLLLDAGDFTEGTSYVSESDGASAVELMNLAGYDACVLGNHEFNLSLDGIRAREAQAEFPILCATVRKDGKALFADNTVFTTPAGTKIGVFGITTPETQSKAAPDKVKGLTFLDGEDFYTCAKQQVRELKAAGCDYIVCLGHMGIDASSVGCRSIDLLEKVSGIDLFLDAHSHSTLEQVIAATNPEHTVDGTVLTSTGTGFQSIGVAKLSKDGVTAETFTPDEVTAYLGTAESEAVAPVAARWAEIKEEIDAVYGAVFARSEVTLNGEKAPNGNRDSETNNGDLVTDAFRWYAVSTCDLAVPDDHVIGLVGGGTLRAPLAVGGICKRDINTIMPFGNTLTVAYLSGAELLDMLEASTFSTPASLGGFPQVSGICYTIDTAKAYDPLPEPYPDSIYYGPKTVNRVTIDAVGGKPFSLTDTYAIATTNYNTDGGDTYYILAAVSDKFDTGKLVDEAVMDYISDALGGVIGKEYAEPQGRITIKAAEAPARPEPASADSYTVEYGDCLWNIAVQFYGDGMKFRSIAAANGIGEPWLILPGQTLAVPAA